MARLTGSLLCAGVDWISVTQIPGDDMNQLRQIALSLAEVELSADMYGSPYAAQGYEGFKVGSITYGERQDGCLLRMGGVLAAAHWRRVYELARHVTRIDLQATYRTSLEPLQCLKTLWSDMRKFARGQKRAPAPSLFVGRDDSITVYSGSRQSDVFLRAYDKGKQSKMDQWQGCVRFEAEFKGKRARLLAGRIARDPDQYQASVGLVCGLFAKRGACLRSLTKELYDRTSLRRFLRCPASQSDVAKTLQWLGTSVRPSVDAIVRRQGETVALRALGLSQT